MNEVKLSKSQIRRKKETYLALEREIKKLEFKIKYSKLENIKISSLKSLLTTLRIIQLLFPYLLTAGITYGVFALLVDVPFVRTMEERYLYTHEERDSLGNIKIEEQYESFDSSNNLRQYSKWTKKDDMFLRTINTFDINKVSIDTINMIIDKDFNVSSIEELFGKPINTKIEKVNKLTEEELLKPSFIEASIYDVDKNTYQTFLQDSSTNLELGFIWLIITLFLELAPAYYREVSSFNLYQCISDINEKYTKEDIDELKQKLKIKMDNINRLKRS